MRLFALLLVFPLALSCGDGSSDSPDDSASSAQDSMSDGVSAQDLFVDLVDSDLPGDVVADLVLDLSADSTPEEDLLADVPQDTPADDAEEHLDVVEVEEDVPFEVVESVCDPVAQTGCEEGEGCYYADPEDGSMLCWTTGALEVGADCSDFAELCGPGSDCFKDLDSDTMPYLYHCRQYCDDAHPCDSGTCTFEPSMIMGVKICL